MPNSDYNGYNLAVIDIKFNESDADQRPDGEPFVKLVRFEAVEALSELFSFTAEVVIAKYSQRTVIAADGVRGRVDIGAALGNPGVVTLLQNGDPVRHFHGLLVEGEFLGDSISGGHYRLVFRPRLYLYSRNKNFQTHQDETSLQIISAVLERCQVKFNQSLKTTYEKRGYCVQYGESDFAFVSRLMEEEGIYYYFSHSETGHTMILCDATTAHTSGTPETLTFNPDMQGLYGGFGDDVIGNWQEHVGTGGQGKVVIWDNLFAVTGKSHEASQSVVESKEKSFNRAQANPAEHYDFEATFELEQPRGGEIDNTIAGKHNTEITRLSKVRLEMLESDRQVFSGVSHSPELACGSLFAMTEHPIAEYNGSFLLVRVRTKAFGAAFETGSGAIDDSGTAFEVIKSSRQWRAHPVTPRPRAYGPETARVVGPAGETIYTDRFGRVKVQFHWDRRGKKDDGSSCWLRVAQTGGLGNVILPRVGHEVIVAFLDGNPDRPIIVGRVFNDENMPVYELPTHKTRAVWRTLSYGKIDTALEENAKALPGDWKDRGFNELRFEDDGGKEEVLIYAQRDMNTYIRQNEKHILGRNRETDIGYDSKVTIGHDSEIVVENNEKRDIKGTNTVTVVKDHKVTLEADATYTTKGKQTLTVTGADMQTYENKSTVEVGQTLSVTGKADIVITATQKIVLKCGGSEIEISPAGVTIKGMKFAAEGSITAVMKGGVSAEVDGGATATVKGGGITTIQGAMVKIN